jgi:hypothetical protein
VTWLHGKPYILTPFTLMANDELEKIGFLGGNILDNANLEHLLIFLTYSYYKRRWGIN